MTWEIIQGDCVDLLRGTTITHSEPYHRVTFSDMPDKSVHCVVTSPPYWALRDYGVSGQLGLEVSPDEFVAAMVGVFQEVWRVLRDDGVCFVNLGDSYASGTKGTGGPPNSPTLTGGRRTILEAARYEKRNVEPGIATGNLVGIPWRVALALQADGWVLRRDIIWSKPNPMPESVNGWRWEQCRVKVSQENQSLRTKAERLSGFCRHSGNTKLNPTTWQDCPGCPKCEPAGGLVLRKGSGRCTTAHEYIFQLVKTGNYYYDCEAVREGAALDDHKKPLADGTANSTKWNNNPQGHMGSNPSGRNRRSVWEIATQPYPEAHFATYPETLVEPCIKAGTSQKGCCPACGSPWARILDDSEEAKARLGTAWHDHQDDLARGQRGTPPALKGPAKITKGWRPTCSCDAGDPVPCTVYDPFTGSGTTGAVAVTHGRDFIGHELSGEYIPLSEKRILEAAEKAGKLTASDIPLTDKPTQLGLLK